MNNTQYVQGDLSDTVFKKCIELTVLNNERALTPEDFKAIKTSTLALAKFRKLNIIFKKWDVKYKCNSNYFTNLDTNFKWYIIGLIYADGNLYYNLGKYGEIVLQLQEIDKPILELIAKNLYIDNYNLYFVKVTSDKRVNNFRLRIGDKQIIKDLVKVGLTPKKSLILQFPEVPNEFLKSFIHGYIDGDGCLFESTYTNYASFISTLSFCETFKEKIDKILNINSRVNKKGNVYKWVVKKQEYLEKFIDWLYKDFDFGLVRKYNKHLKIKENILNNLNKN